MINRSMEAETNQKIRENRQFQQDAVGENRAGHAQKPGNRPDATDNVGDILGFHVPILIKTFIDWQFLGFIWKF